MSRTSPTTTVLRSSFLWSHGIFCLQLKILYFIPYLTIMLTKNKCWMHYLITYPWSQCGPQSSSQKILSSFYILLNNYLSSITYPISVDLYRILNILKKNQALFDEWYLVTLFNSSIKIMIEFYSKLELPLSNLMYIRYSFYGIYIATILEFHLALLVHISVVCM